MRDPEGEIRDSRPAGDALPTPDVDRLLRRARRRTLTMRASGGLAAVALLAAAAVTFGGWGPPTTVELRPADPAETSEEEPFDGEADEEADGEATPDPIARAEQLRAAIADVLGDSAEAQRIARAEARLVTECLRDAGVDHTMPDPTQVGQQDVQLLEGEDLWLAAGDSFGVADMLAERLAGQGEQGATISGDVPDGFEEAYRGDPPETVTVETHRGDVGEIAVGGCRGQAKSELHGVDEADYQRTRLSLLPLTDLHRDVVTESDVASATRQWSRCMDDRDVAVSSPDDLHDPLEGEIRAVMERGEDPGELVAAEEALAADDRECKAATDLRARYAEAFAAEAERALEELEAPAERYREMLDHAVDVSDEVLSE